MARRLSTIGLGDQQVRPCEGRSRCWIGAEDFERAQKMLSGINAAISHGPYERGYDPIF